MEKRKKTSDLKKIGKAMLTDVETCDYSQIIMELSFLVVNQKFAKLQENCFIIKEVWENEEYRNGVFAKNKLEHWQEMLDNNTAQLISIYDLYKFINKTIKKEKITIFGAYNAQFDIRAIENTYHRFGIDKHKNYEKENQLLKLDIMCLWNYATRIYCSEDYVNWAIHNEKFTSTGKIQSNAQAVYQFLTQNNHFIETHFGIEDLQIEYTIYVASALQGTLANDSSIVLNKNGCWQLVERYRKELSK